MVERRKQRRKKVQGALTILWQAPDDLNVEGCTYAECVDVSENGVRLRVPEPLPYRSIITFNSIDLKLAGRGSVRHCAPRKAGFDIGVECFGGTSAC